MGTCRYCNQSAGFLRKQHGPCRDLHTAGILEMTQLAAQAAGTSSFNETALRTTLQAIANRARATPDDISQAIASGFAQGVNHALQDGTLTQEEETNLQTFRDLMSHHDLPNVIIGTTARNRASADRITAQARHAAWTTAAAPSRSWTTPSGGPACPTRTAGSSWSGLGRRPSRE